MWSLIGRNTDSVYDYAYDFGIDVCHVACSLEFKADTQSII